MPNLSLRWLPTCAVLLAGFAQAATATEILIVDEKSSPESLTIAPGGILIVGSASTPFVYKVRPGSTTAEKFVDATAEGPGTFFFGMLADATTGTLWTCQLTPVPDAKPARRHTSLRGFDLSTGTQKLRWDLPGDNNVCNDFSIGPDKALYISDTGNGKIFKLPAGASTAQLFLEDVTALRGIDGITFLNGTLYVNNVITSKIYRIPIDASGKAGSPVEIPLDQPIKGPDGMRAANGKLLVAENGSGKISVITLIDNTGKVTVIREGFKTPTAVEPAGDVIWIAERGAGKAVSIPMPK
jgi:sugar lactone lactonase YvrE